MYCRSEPYRVSPPNHMFKLLYKFICYLFSGNTDPAAKRAKKKMIADPDAAFEVINKTLGSSTGPINLRQPQRKEFLPPNENGDFTFVYIALDQNGKEATGNVLAQSESEAINQIRSRGLYPTKVNRAFTLIELLVVITIIGVFSAMWFGASFGTNDEQDFVSPEQVISELQQKVTELQTENASLQKLLIMQANMPK